MWQLEGDEKEVQEGRWLKVLTPNKLLTRIVLLLAQVKVGNNINKLKNKIQHIVYVLYQHSQITKTL